MLKDLVYIIYIYVYEFILSEFSASDKIMEKLHMNDVRKNEVKNRIKARNNKVYVVVIVLLVIFYAVYYIYYLMK